MLDRDLWLPVLQALFYATFLPRFLERRKSSEADARTSGPTRTARFSRGLIVLHAIAFFTLYMGINLAFTGSRHLRERGGTDLFPPQRLAGALLMVAAIGLAVWALVYFRSWRIRAEITADHELATEGPFRWVRNPIYLGMDLMAVGSFLWIPRPIVGVGALLVIVSCDLRARAEERILLAAFGDRYRQYRARVKRFVPGVY